MKILILISFLFLSSISQAEENDHTKGETCASCHQGSLMAGHTKEFFETSHGLMARADREMCFECHGDKEYCQDCHISIAPQWENDEFRKPGLNIKNREEHISISKEHRKSCMECHSTVFHIQCSECHQKGEAWQNN